MQSSSCANIVYNQTRTSSSTKIRQIVIYLLESFTIFKIVIMPSARFFQHSGPLGKSCEEAGFSNAVVLPPNAQIVISAGQAGMNLKTGTLVESSPLAQREAAFDCCDAALKAAGVTQGLACAHKIVSYFVDTRYDPVMMEIWRRRYPE